MDRTHGDMRMWSKHLSNKQYYQINPKNKDEFRTLFVRMNPFTGKPQVHFQSNYVNGTPPPNIPAIHPLHLQRLMTLQHSGDFY